MSKFSGSENEELPSRTDELFCFAIYSAGNVINRSYTPHLSELGLTYPQYVTLVALWEKDAVSVGHLCQKLLLETSTLTPILQKLEKQGHITRTRDRNDERKVVIRLSASGRAMQEKATAITRCMIDGTGMELEELDQMVSAIARMRDNLIAQRKT